MVIVLDDARFLESPEGTVLLDRPQSFGRNVDDDRLFELRNINALPLDVRITADLASRIELGRTGAVRIAPADK